MKHNEDLLIEELKDLLCKEAPSEAAFARAYVEFPEEYSEEADEKIAGIPVEGVVALLGPVVLPWLIEIAKKIIKDIGEEIYKKILKSGVDSLFAKILKIFSKQKKAEIKAGKKEDTIIAITNALIKAGWDAGAAGAKAEEVWKHGESLGRKMIENIRDD
ncbi:MAG: hypothetical protein JXD23_02405 [Spirochaetales bacterium]|nr:hypothetical protein [Spirochaetales bacterium]